ncbi:hypothetical protein PoMZ_02859 [Pyricularia oryzae]|uniref:Zn(2)-C6 fungal-type domain-containing protein n=1 Tax=Pyricularia oryzae TaxID=318829 RepID=A0A4P7N9D3_PYROR|nr:hypothetical protein PoMZ_02859 [Pyricularia oryzae]
MTEAMPQSGPDAGSVPGAHPGGVRKKFATPPAKLACLACRASRTRCNGGRPCASCQSKGRECVYMPSKRGGARVRKKPKQNSESAVQQQCLPEVPEIPQEPISIERYIDPGAGLKQLGDYYPDSDLIFDSLFMNDVSSYIPNEASLNPSPQPPVPTVPMVRTYKDNVSILNAYYVYIHPYFPILPPPTTTPLDNPVARFQNQPSDFEGDFEPTSAIALAISAVLALIPCANDVNHATPESLRFRRTYAQLMAQSAIEHIEEEDEIPESSTIPQEALSYDAPPSPPSRSLFHPDLPQELENIVALDILSVYEYGQRGNLRKMQSRAGQAFFDAMALNLHNCTEEDRYSEARRRVWWMTYICICQGSIVSNTKPTFAPFASTFTAQFPVILSDPEAFPAFVQAQQAILSATQFVIDLNKTLKENGDMSRIYQRMQELETTLEPLILQSEAFATRPMTTTTVNTSEELVGHTLRCMARIKLSSARIKVHRYCAFFDLPVFTGKHCDLKSKNANDAQEPRRWHTCSCSPWVPTPSTTSVTSPADSASQANMSPAASSMQASVPSPRSEVGVSTPGSVMTTCPFSSHESAKICLRSALNIAADFARMPYPNPSALPPFPSNHGAAPGAVGNGNASDSPVFYLSPTSTIIAPRTMPSFACCAMQCAYSLLMVHEKTKALYPYSYPGPATVEAIAADRANGGPLVSNLLVRLQQGLMSILGTLENYGTAFEALGGMRDQIRNAIEPTMALQF